MLYLDSKLVVKIKNKWGLAVKIAGEGWFLHFFLNGVKFAMKEKMKWSVTLKVFLFTYLQAI